MLRLMVTDDAAQLLIASFLQKAVEDLRDCVDLGLVSLDSPFPKRMSSPPKGMNHEDVWHLASMFYSVGDLMELFRAIDPNLDEDDVRSML